MQQRLLFLGPPGAGKGTQAKILCKKQDLLHLSTGDLLRAEVAASSSLGLQAAEVMNKGELVSDSLVLSIVEQRLSLHQHGWLLDGFPRNVSQAKSLEGLLISSDQLIEAVILMELDDEVLIQRLLARGRADDNESVIRHRLDVYRDQTAPLISHYRTKGLLQSVAAHGSVEEITRSIQGLLS